MVQKSDFFEKIGFLVIAQDIIYRDIRASFRDSEIGFFRKNPISSLIPRPTKKPLSFQKSGFFINQNRSACYFTAIDTA
jgi:hypothetical protein